MKSTGIIRRVDELGRIVLPIELRRSLGISEKDPMEISVEDGSIILRKHQDACLFCGSARDQVEFRDKTVCRDCVNRLASLPR